MDIFRDCDAAAAISGNAAWFVHELAGTWYDSDTANRLFETVNRPEDLEIELRQSVAKTRDGQAFEYDIGDTAVGRCVACSLLGFNQAVGKLCLSSAVNPVSVSGKIELLSIGPDAPNAGDLALTQSNGEIGKVPVLGRPDSGRTGTSAAAAETLAATTATSGLGGRDDLFFELRSPDHLTGNTRTPINTRDRRPLTRGRNLEIAQPGPFDDLRLTGGAEQRLIDVGPGSGTNGLSNRRTGDAGTQYIQAAWQDCTACGRAQG